MVADANVVSVDNVFGITEDEVEAAAMQLCADAATNQDSEQITASTIEKMVKAAGLTSPHSVKELHQTLTQILLPRRWETLDYLALRDIGSDLYRGEEIIEGILRDGEVAFIGSVSKAGKSWMLGGLIWSTISGRLWLGKKVKQGKVLLIDNELKRRELDWRNSQIAGAMNYEPASGDLTVISRRGESCDIQELSASLPDLNWSEYSLIVIDAIYKTIPDGKSENDNEAMGKLMNCLQSIGEKTGVAVVAVHHATKGDQSSKTTLDILSGAGSFGRALDSMIALRDHEQDGLNVVEFRTRTNLDPVSISARFDFPLWVAVATDPVLRTSQRGKAGIAADEKIFELVRDGGWTSASMLKNRLGMNRDRAAAALYRLQDAGRLVSESRPNRIKSGDPVDYFSLPTPKNEGTN